MVSWPVFLGIMNFLYLCQFFNFEHIGRVFGFKKCLLKKAKKNLTDLFYL